MTCGVCYKSRKEIGCENMLIVAKNIGNDWKKLARHFPPVHGDDLFSEAELDTIYKDYITEGIEEVRYKMLVTWKQRMAKEATVGLLAKVLLIIERSDIAKKLKL